MNKLLQKLADQCRTEYRDGHGNFTEQFDEQKFAELIVCECAEICKKQEYDYWRSSEDQDFTPQDCADAIEQHFGIEE